MPKSPFLTPNEIAAKAVGGRAVCRTCAPFERRRFLRQPNVEHARCDDFECGCSCHDAERRS